MIKQISYDLTKVNIALSLQVLGRTLYFTDISEIVPVHDQIKLGSPGMCGGFTSVSKCLGPGIFGKDEFSFENLLINYFSEN